MDNSTSKKNRSKIKRVMRVRKKLKGTAERPRLSISKTNRHIYAQIIDDMKGITIGGIGTLSKENKTVGKKSKETARLIGKQIAEIAKKNQVNAVVFDRGPNKYHGIIAELAEGAREAGLQF